MVKYRTLYFIYSLYKALLHVIHWVSHSLQNSTTWHRQSVLSKLRKLRRCSVVCIVYLAQASVFVHGVCCKVKAKLKCKRIHCSKHRAQLMWLSDLTTVQTSYNIVNFSHQLFSEPYLNVWFWNEKVCDELFTILFPDLKPTFKIRYCWSKRNQSSATLLFISHLKCCLNHIWVECLTRNNKIYPSTHLVWVPLNILFTDIHVFHLCFSTRSWSCWICTSSVLSLAPAAANPHLMAYRRQTALPLVNHRTATATRHKHLFMSQHPHQPRIKHTNLTNSSFSTVQLCTHTHKGTQSSYITCLITRWQSQCRGEEHWSHPAHHQGSTLHIHNWTLKYRLHNQSHSTPSHLSLKDEDMEIRPLQACLFPQSKSFPW